MPRLLVHEPRPWQSELVDLSQLSEDQQQAEIQRRMDADAARVFSLLEDSLLSTRILRLGPESHVLLLNMHHIVSDGWSMGVLLQEIHSFALKNCTILSSSLQFMESMHYASSMLR